MYAAWERGDKNIPLYGGANHLAFNLAILGVLAATVAITVATDRVAAIRRSTAGQWLLALSLALPVALCAMALTVVAFLASGAWDGWFVQPTWLVHRGRANWPHTRPLGLWLTLLALWILIAWLIRRPMLRRRWLPRRIRWAALLGMVLLLCLPFGYAHSPFHPVSTVFRLLALAGVWSALFALTLLFPSDAELRLRRWMPRNHWRTAACTRCAYDLTGTVLANRRTCPECGQAIPPLQWQHLRQAASQASTTST